MTAEPVARDAIETLLDAARWAPTAGNRHLRRFVATDDPAVLRVLRAVSPGMPAAPHRGDHDLHRPRARHPLQLAA
jgi:nitroreductase